MEIMEIMESGEQPEGDNADAFELRRIAYPSASLVGLWILLFVGRIFGIEYDHSNGALVLVVLLPWTAVVLLLLAWRIPAAIRQLIVKPRLRNWRSLATIAIGLIVAALSIASLVPY